MAIELTFAAPPGTNNLYKNAGKRRVATERYRAWQQSAGWEIRTQLMPLPGMWHIEGPFSLTIWLPPGLDLDNCKAIPDLLGPGAHGMNVTEDDRQMVELHVYRDRSIGKQCRVRVEAKL